MDKTILYIAGGLALLWFLFFRKGSITGGANLSVATGNNATPYTGYPAGSTPGGVPIAGGALGYGPPPPPVDSTGSTLAGVGGLLTGLGSAASGIIGALGNSGVIGGSSSGGGGSYDTGGSYDDSSIDDGTAWG